MAKPNPHDPNNKAWGGDGSKDNCSTCGGSGTVGSGEEKRDCGPCGGSGKK